MTKKRASKQVDLSAVAEGTTVEVLLRLPSQLVYYIKEAAKRAMLPADAWLAHQILTLCWAKDPYAAQEYREYMGIEASGIDAVVAQIKSEQGQPPTKTGRKRSSREQNPLTPIPDGWPIPTPNHLWTPPIKTGTGAPVPELHGATIGSGKAPPASQDPQAMANALWGDQLAQEATLPSLEAKARAAREARANPLDTHPTAPLALAGIKEAGLSEADQAAYGLRMLAIWASDPANINRPVSAQVLWKELEQISPTHGAAGTWHSAASMAAWFSRNRTAVKKVVKMGRRTSPGGTWVYVIEGLADVDA